MAANPEYMNQTLVNFTMDGEEVSSYEGETLIQTDLHHVSGHSIVAENDILTAVIATENTRFLLWVSADGTYSRAQFGTFPRAVILQRKN